MFTSYEFVFVEKFVSYQARKNKAGYAVDRSYRYLVIRPPKSVKTYSFILNRSIEVPELRRNDKVRLIIDLFTRGYNRKAEIKILAVELLQ
ncbi:hypothetical protein [Enterococcus termitis]|uniref:Uncharacterized protein n=1 Tax=Enterococcus termitis TaxID=332950 RepID=A0A1E5G9C9_9ENTE|nr:hypothetical protein [Enterococcus termitis]OEG08830.1 hypothetical protein BCR25_12925 [Enterococcus termitis]OEG08840.1 hypothetical protein BCR25_12975 [Enterococcus termitis]OJG94711.1 hypothetical protein RV18_GL003187 [Enterococcus termitis]